MQSKFILAFGVCHKDVDQLSRLLDWIKHIGIKGVEDLDFEVLIYHNQKLKAHVLLPLVVQQAEVFGVPVHTAMPDDELESGWPRACSHQFSRMLSHCLKAFPERDVLFLEADVVPLVPDWLAVLHSEWLKTRKAGKSFCGAYVPLNKDREPGPNDRPHMTGNAWYGSDWKKLIPELEESYERVTGAWDVDFGDELLSNARITEKIQHEWGNNTILNQGDNLFHKPADLEKLKPGVVLYHQCKRGDLMRMLSAERYPGWAGTLPTFPPTQLRLMTSQLRVRQIVDAAHMEPIPGTEKRSCGRCIQTFLINDWKTYGQLLPYDVTGKI